MVYLRFAAHGLLQRSATSVVIPGTAPLAHLRENVAAGDVELPADAVAELDAIGTGTQVG